MKNQRGRGGMRGGRRGRGGGRGRGGRGGGIKMGGDNDDGDGYGDDMEVSFDVCLLWSKSREQIFNFSFICCVLCIRTVVKYVSHETFQ